jgi:6-phosphogluconolactonase
MRFAVEVFEPDTFAAAVAERITKTLPATGAVIITGGTTAAKVYPLLADLERWNELDVLFSDERCVPPDHEESNFRMATSLFLGRTRARVHRMQGERDPKEAALGYHEEIAEAIAAGPSFAVMGLGGDCHVGALFPGSPALEEANYCAAVDRPDGMKGLTLTPSAMLAARSIRLLATGTAKAEAVMRVVKGREEAASCPALVLASHPDIALWVDTGAATLL